MAWKHERRRTWPPSTDLAPTVYGQLIEQIACPAWFCSPDGAVLHCNSAARRLWGGCPSPAEEARWDGFAALYRADGSALERSAAPAALALRGGAAIAPTELVAESADGQKRCLVVHARPVGQAGDAAAGVLCSLTDISERRRLEHELAFARDSRTGFLRMLAHELRNPLASVMAVAAILRRQPGEPGIARMARVIERQTRQLGRFIDDLLDGARIDHACEIPVAMRAASLDEVLACARDMVEGLLRERGQQLHTNIDMCEQDCDAVLWCDPERLGQALGNALHNASQYSDDGAGISLAVAVDGVFLEIRVVDRGIGVESDELPLLFEPFRKFAPHPGRVVAGAGLGLAIARSVTRAHGGQVSADSPGRGQGTCLRFVLPVVRQTAPA